MTGTIVSRGGYSEICMYEIIQHKYMGGGHPGAGGWIEFIEIKNPPDNKCPFVIYEYLSHADFHESFFWEWQTLDEGLDAYNKFAGWHTRNQRFEVSPGFLRFVNCQSATPWFYAKEDDRVVGDLVTPHDRLF